MRHTHLPLLLISSLLSSVVIAADPWTLTTADFRQQPATLSAIDETGIKLVSPAATTPQLLPWPQFLEIARASSSPSITSPFILHLSTSDRLYGQPIAVQGEELRWNTPLLGELTLPLLHVRAMTRARATQPLLGAATATAQTEDTLLLANGDSLRGIITDIQPAHVTLQVGGKPTSVPTDTVSAILLAAAAAAPPSTDRAFRLEFDDGSSLTAQSIRTTGAKLTLTLADKTTPAIDLSRLRRIEQVNGPVSWLSTRTPAESVQVPYDTDLTWPARMNQSVTGKPLRFADQIYARGIGVHAYSRLTYPLDGTYKTFRTQYALDAADTDARLADVTVRIKLDDRTVHEQTSFKPGTLSPVIRLDLAAARTLTLEVDYGLFGDRQDRFNWIEPALLRQ